MAGDRIEKAHENEVHSAQTYALALKDNNEEQKEDGLPRNLSSQVVQARSSLLKALMGHKLANRFSSTAFNVENSLKDSSANSGAVEASCSDPPQSQENHHERQVTNDSGLMVVSDSNSFESFSLDQQQQILQEEGPPSLTPQERQYLEQLMLKGDVATLEAATNKLQDPLLFPKEFSVECPQEEDASTIPPVGPPSNNRKEPIKRRDSKLQQRLYKIHQEKYLKQSKEHNSMLEFNGETTPQESATGLEDDTTPEPHQSTAASNKRGQENKYCSRAMRFQSQAKIQNSILLSSSADAEETHNEPKGKSKIDNDVVVDKDANGQMRRQDRYKGRALQLEAQSKNSILLSSSVADLAINEITKAPQIENDKDTGNRFQSRAMRLSSQLQAQDSILETSNSDVESLDNAIEIQKTPENHSEVSPTGSWNPMEDSGHNDSEEKKDDQQEYVKNYDNMIDEKEDMHRNDSFVDIDPFRDIASWIDGGQGVEVNDSGIPLIGRSSSVASKSMNSIKDPTDVEPILDKETVEDSDASAHRHRLQNSRPFRILGTSADDVSCHPHVLSPPLMESLLAFMPEGSTDSNYWLKYSLVRDGANLWTMLRQIRASNETLLAIETADGQVFGSFTNQSWRFSKGWYGGQQAFLWKMRHSRSETTASIHEQAVQESEVQVFPVRPGNVAVQYCSKKCLMLGRGEIQNHGPDKLHGKHYGHGLYLDPSLLRGTTSNSETFGNPCLVDKAERGSRFEVSNIEIWTLTPHDNVDEAQQSEFSTLFLEGGRKEKNLNLLGILVGGTI